MDDSQQYGDTPEGLRLESSRWKTFCWGTEGRPEEMCAFLRYSSTDDGDLICAKSRADAFFREYLEMQIRKGLKVDRCSGPPDFRIVIHQRKKTA